MARTISIRPWGNSHGLRIPKDILDKANIGLNETLSIDVEGETIILKKAFKHKTFEERLDEFGGEIDVCDFDWGEPKGREMV